MNGLVTGRVVYFVLNAAAVDEIMRRRTDGPSIAERMKLKTPTWPAGAQAHIGNPVVEGQICPAIVVAINSVDNVNLKVLLDGSDVYWARSVAFHEGHTDRPAIEGEPAPPMIYNPYSWHWMFEKQATRYTPGEAEIRAMLESVISGDNGVVRGIAREEAEKLAHRIGDHFEQAAKAQGINTRAAAGADADLEHLREGEVTYRSRVETALQEAENLVSRHQVDVAYAQLKRDLTRLLEDWPK